MVVGNSARETIASGTVTTRTAGTRVRPSLSWKPAMMTSTIEISEVNPAKVRAPKNRTPIRVPAGASEMIVGKAMKARPMPLVATSPTATPDALAMKPRAAKTPMPARISKLEFAKPTTSAELVRSVLGLR